MGNGTLDNSRAALAVENFSISKVNIALEGTVGHPLYGPRSVQLPSAENDRLRIESGYIDYTLLKMLALDSAFIEVKRKMTVPGESGWTKRPLEIVLSLPAKDGNAVARKTSISFLGAVFLGFELTPPKYKTGMLVMYDFRASWSGTVLDSENEVLPRFEDSLVRGKR